MSGVKHLKAEHAQQIAEQKKSVEAAKAKAEKAHQEFRDKRREGHKDSIADHSRKSEVEERESRILGLETTLDFVRFSSVDQCLLLSSASRRLSLSHATLPA